MRKQIIEPLNQEFGEVVEAVARHKTRSVFSSERQLQSPNFQLPENLKLNQRQKMDGLKMLKLLSDKSVPLVFFDPQYRSVMDKQNYGNEGENRGKARTELPQQTNAEIKKFLKEIERVLIPSGHLMLWVDKFIVVSGVHTILEGCSLQLVDMITWDKARMGMGYRSRRFSEHLLVLQKPPVRAKGVWIIHNIPDVWREKIENGDKNHTHAKPVGLQEQLIKAVSDKDDIIVDPSAGGYSVLKACQKAGRNFLGCDIHK
jgi:site-specific DNA-methyltransferase (adenine-specific)